MSVLPFDVILLISDFLKQYFTMKITVVSEKKLSRVMSSVTLELLKASDQGQETYNQMVLKNLQKTLPLYKEKDISVPRVGGGYMNLQNTHGKLIASIIDDVDKYKSIKYNRKEDIVEGNKITTIIEVEITKQKTQLNKEIAINSLKLKV